VSVLVNLYVVFSLGVLVGFAAGVFVAMMGRN
jgi:hypothetical protein